ncbi:MAG: MFS transporter [Lentilitoribacter sp.]
MKKILGPMPPARIAVSILFFINGMLIGAWAPMIPTFKARLDLTESQIGLIILALGFGSLLSMPFVGAFIAKNGTRLPIKYLAFICSFGIPCLTLVPEFWTAVVVMFLFGATWAGMDVAMNSNVIEVEKQHGFPIMSSCHGFWSIGALVSALIGGFTLSSFGEIGHGIFWQIVFLVLFFYAFPKLQKRTGLAEEEEKPKLQFPRVILPYLLGVVALFSVVPEGMIIDWSALFLNTERGVSIAWAGTGFAATSTAMAIMRFSGDHLRKRFGAEPTLRFSVITAIIGFSLVTLSPSPFWAVLGFFISGIGLANLFPIAISAAGNVPNIPGGIAVSMVTTVGYGGILLAPPLFGFIAQTWSYSAVYAVMPFCLMIVFFLVWTVRHADAPADASNESDK